MILIKFAVKFLKFTTAKVSHFAGNIKLCLEQIKMMETLQINHIKAALMMMKMIRTITEERAMMVMLMLTLTIVTRRRRRKTRRSIRNITNLEAIIHPGQMIHKMGKEERANDPQAHMVQLILVRTMQT